MSKYKDYPFVVSINEEVEASSLISLHDDNIEDDEKQDTVTKI